MTYTLTAKQIRAIYDAGRDRGRDEATAYEWGSRPNAPVFNELENVMIWTDECGQITGLDYDDKKAWWVKFLQEMED